MARRSGFTLIELMVVVGIMVLIATIVVSGSFGMSRASGYLAAENIVYNTLQAARQKACTNGKRVTVAFVKRDEAYGDGDNFALVTVEAVGTITEKVEARYIRDRCSSLVRYTGKTASGGDYVGNDSIWNLATGAVVAGPFKIVKGSTTTTIPGETGKYSYDVTQLELTGSSDSFNQNYWKKGDPYGFQIGEMQELPTGFKFGFGGAGKSPEGQIIVFEPDGTSFYGKSQKGGIKKNVDEATVVIYEEIAKDKAVKVIVKDGAIRVSK